MFLKIAIQLSVLMTFVNTIKVTNTINKKMALQVLKIGPTSMVVSSLAVRFALCKLASAAEGEVKEELLSALGFSQEKMVEQCFKNIEHLVKPICRYDLLMHNKIYVNYSTDINDAFLKDSKQNFGVLVEKVGFNYPYSVTQHINGWFSRAMLKRVTDVIDVGDVDNRTTMLIVSALHFRGELSMPFKIKQTKMKNFYLHNSIGTVQIPMMTQSESFQYLNDDKNKIKIIKMHYDSPSAYITIVLPHSSSGLPEFLDKLYKNPDLLIEMFPRLKHEYLQLFLPKLKIKTYVDWTGFLKEMGLIKIFDADSSGLKSVLNKDHQNQTMALNCAKQKVFFELDEMVKYAELKSEAERMTFPTRPYLPDVEFTVDRPFYFVVTLEDNHIVHELFNGVYYGPQ